LPPPPKRWDCRWVPPCLAIFYFLIQKTNSKCNILSTIHMNTDVYGHFLFLLNHISQPAIQSGGSCYCVLANGTWMEVTHAMSRSGQEPPCYVLWSSRKYPGVLNHPLGSNAHDHKHLFGFPVSEKWTSVMLSH
jgi:hypothetical protein